jgi:HSP20 family molecular chaperone IbpA
MSAVQRPKDSRARMYVPAVDIYQTEEGRVLVADLPGVSREGLSVEVKPHFLTITGRVAVPAVGGEEHLTEFQPRDFYRAFTLTDEADLEGIVFTISAGVLKVRVPRRRPSPGRRIEVKVE